MMCEALASSSVQTNCSTGFITQLSGARAGNYRSIPTDCPQRDERQGWLGDRSEESRGETFLFDNSNLYAKWLQDIADAQRPEGSVPDVAPSYWPIYSDKRCVAEQAVSLFRACYTNNLRMSALWPDITTA